MKFIKLVHLNIDVDDPIRLFSSPDMLLQLIVRRYEKRCVSGCFIDKIIKIVKRSECVIHQTTSCGGTISSICEAEVITLVPGEIITDCTIIKRLDSEGGNMVLCSSSQALITIMHNKIMDSFPDGLTIPVRVRKTKFQFLSPEISVVATPYSFQKIVAVYKLAPPTADTIELIETGVKKRITEEESYMELLNSGGGWKVFDDLMYAYQTEQSAPEKAVVMNINELLGQKFQELGEIYVSRDNKIRLSKPNVYVYKSKNDIPTGAKICEDYSDADVLTTVFEDYCSHLKMLREMVSIYATEELNVKHLPLWKYINDCKISNPK